MKRIIFTVISILLLGNIACAEISQGTDSFTGGKTYTSGYHFAKDESAYFGKILDSNSPIYKVSFWAKAMLGERYSKTPLEIKIDDMPIQTIEIKELPSIPTDPFNKNAPVLIRVEASVPSNIVDQIKIAKRVALKVYKDKFSPIIIILPENVLVEWKQVINTEK